MRPIPQKLRQQISEDQFMKVCARSGLDCKGQITWEHSFIYSGRQINEAWAIIPLCVYHHLGAGMDKRINEQIAFNRATKEELNKYPKRNWNLLKQKYETN